MRSEQQRVGIIQQIQKEITMIQICKPIKELLYLASNKKLDVTEAYNVLVQAIETRILDLIKENQNTLSLLQSELKESNLKKFNQNYVIQNSLLKHLKIGEPKLKDSIQYSQTGIKRIISELKQKAITVPITLENLSDHLIQLQMIGENIPEFIEIIQEEIKEIICHFKKRIADKKDISKLAILLSSKPQGQNIVSQHGDFKGYEMTIFYEKVNRMKIEHVIQQLNGDNLQIDVLQSKYYEYYKIYKDAVQQGLTPQYDMGGKQKPVDLNFIFCKITSLCNRDAKQWSDTQIKNLPRLLAYIFALWTLTNDKVYNDIEGTEEEKEHYLLQPHPAQVISIFRILGIGYQSWNIARVRQAINNDVSQIFGGTNITNQALYDNMVEIKTGEGKSITLAAVSIVFALHGFEVSCACYSEYLSQRDYQEFEALFSVLGVKEQIKYGTFNNLCEQFLNKDGNIRDIYLNRILVNKQTFQRVPKNERPRILMIDEVDVFFSKDFYGAQYRPLITIGGPEVESLVDMIWAQKSNKQILNLRSIKATQEYQQCQKIFNEEYQKLLDEAVKDMVCDVKDYQSHEYIEKNGRIGYKDQDQISFTISYGYKTMWAYYFESERGKITQNVLKEQKLLGFSCGEFSYSEIPLYYQMILGVSGTLKTLTAAEEKIVKEEYNINNMTFAPSVYGKSKLQYSHQKDIHIFSKDQYYNELNNNLKENLNTSRGDRAVIVFFKNYTQLMKFYNFDKFEHKNECLILEESLSNEEKKNLISTSTYKGRVTLATRKFGRGTDFICRDKSVLEAGGVHVIQTFMSEELSEEVQIMGRTARQGDKGSYCMILLDEDLKAFNIGETQISRHSKEKDLNFYTMLKDARETHQRIIKTDEANSLVIKRAQHQEGYICLQKVLKEESKESNIHIYKFLFNQNRGRAQNVTKTLILMDATGSMSAMISKTKNAVNTMFQEASQILIDKGIEPKLFEIQFACYRNYSSGNDLILEYSSWESNPTQLKKFMERITSSGGQGNEAIEIGLFHANEEFSKLENRETFQVFLIGDAPPNTEAEVQSKRQYQQTWKDTKYQKPTHYTIELKKLIANQIQVFTFYVKDKAKTSFAEIAKKTGAQCQFLDINNEINGHAMLINLFVKQILQKVGDSNGGIGAELVAAFQAKRGYR